MTYVGKSPADIIATAVDTTTGTFSGDLTVDTNTLYVDSANNRVGIGTASPTTALTLGTSHTATVQNGGSNSAPAYAITSGALGTSGITAPAANSLGFVASATERMRIDSSGNLLVGKTSTAAGAGAELRADGQIVAYRSNNRVVYLDRLGSDGDILEFLKDSGTIGSIGALSSKIYIGSNDTGIFFDSLRDALVPYAPNASTRSDAIDLGRDVVRYKDLYLSGGAYIGGTGSANKLDDYEEGTWTATDVSGAGLTLGVGTTAQYTKIGRLVTVNAHINFPSTSNTAALEIGGLPFTNGGSYSFGSVRIQNLGVSNLIVQVHINSSYVLVYRESDIQVLNNDCSSQYVLFSATYMTS